MISYRNSGLSYKLVVIRQLPKRRNSNFEFIFSRRTFYDVLNISAKKYLEIHVDLKDHHFVGIKNIFSTENMDLSFSFQFENNNFCNLFIF
jgi:hypothetical protein